MPANSIFSGPVTSTFNAMHFGEILFKYQCQKKKKKKKKDKKAEGFEISHFY